MRTAKLFRQIQARQSTRNFQRGFQYGVAKLECGHSLEAVERIAERFRTTPYPAFSRGIEASLDALEHNPQIRPVSSQYPVSDQATESAGAP